MTTLPAAPAPVNTTPVNAPLAPSFADDFLAAVCGPRGAGVAPDADLADTTDHSPYDGPTAADLVDYAVFLADRDAAEFDAWVAAMEADRDARRDSPGGDPWATWNDAELVEATGRTCPR